MDEPESIELSNYGSSEENYDDGPCDPGLFLPVWKSFILDLSVGDRLARGLIYFLFLIYTSIGLWVFISKLMAAVEVIVYKRKKTTGLSTNSPNRIRNEVVVNLTLIAITSSLPEIIWSLLVLTQNFSSGDSGPIFIIGSTAFYLFLAGAVSISAIPNGQVRKLKKFNVFGITILWNIFAYVWMLIILKVNTPGVINEWEAWLTLSFFPFMVLSAYAVDYLDTQRNLKIDKEGGRELEQAKGGALTTYEDSSSGNCHDYYFKILFDIRKECRHLNSEQGEYLALKNILNELPKSRPFYRIDATSKLIASQTPITKFLKEFKSNRLIRRGEHIMRGDPLLEVNGVSETFKETVEKLIYGGTTPLLQTFSWTEQFIDAITVRTDGDEEEKTSPSFGNYVLHCLYFVWKILSALVPPTNLLRGYPTLIVSFFSIGCLVVLMSDLSSQLGCTIGFKDSVNVIVVIAIVIYIPEIIATKNAAIQEKYADKSIGVIPGFNSVKIFLASGIPWTIGTWQYGIIYVDPGSLAYIIAICCPLTILAYALLIIRRVVIGGELGGPTFFKYFTSVSFICFWLVFIFMSALEAYGVLQGF